MQVLLIGEFVAKTRLSVNHLRAHQNRARKTPPFPAPIPIGARRRGWIERGNGVSIISIDMMGT